MTVKATRTPQERSNADRPGKEAGPYTVSLCVDLEGIDAGSAREAVETALDAVKLGMPSLFQGVDTGFVAHVVPQVGECSEWVVKTMKRVG